MAIWDILPPFSVSPHDAEATVLTGNEARNGYYLNSQDLSALKKMFSIPGKL